MAVVVARHSFWILDFQIFNFIPNIWSWYFYLVGYIYIIDVPSHGGWLRGCAVARFLVFGFLVLRFSFFVLHWPTA